MDNVQCTGECTLYDFSTDDRYRHRYSAALRSQSRVMPSAQSRHAPAAEPAPSACSDTRLPVAVCHRAPCAASAITRINNALSGTMHDAGHKRDGLQYMYSRPSAQCAWGQCTVQSHQQASEFERSGQCQWLEWLSYMHWQHTRRSHMTVL